MAIAIAALVVAFTSALVLVAFRNWTQQQGVVADKQIDNGDTAGAIGTSLGVFGVFALIVVGALVVLALTQGG